MTTKDKKKNNEESIELSSSPCSIADVDPDYMGLNSLDKKTPNPKKKKQNKND